MGLYKEGVSVWTGNICVSMRTSGGLLWTSYFYVTFFRDVHKLNAYKRNYMYPHVSLQKSLKEFP